MSLLSGETISKYYRNRLVLDSVQIGIAKGSAIGIAGSTGSGKSTMLRILAGLIEPDNGAVYYAGKKIEGPLTKLIPGHDKIAYLSQHFELRNNYRVEEIFEYSNRLSESEADEIFLRCDVKHLLKRRTDELSGGERQRIALARVLITRPDVLLLDEPFSNLDLIQKTALKNVLQSVIKAFELTTVLVSHDPQDLFAFAEILYIMRDGQFIQTGTAADIYYRPADNYVAGLMGQYSLIDETTIEMLLPQQSVQKERPHFLRPEMLSIVPAGEGKVNGIVDHSWFTGPFWQAKVIVNENSLIINHKDPTLYKGQIVGVRYVG